MTDKQRKAVDSSEGSVELEEGVQAQNGLKSEELLQEEIF